MLKHIFNKDDTFFFENKNQRHVGEHLKKMTPNSDLQFMLLLLLLFASIGAFVQSRFLGSKKLNSLIDSIGLSHKFTVDKALG